MLKDVIIPEDVVNTPWCMEDGTDYEAREWIWHQLIGETGLGDTVEFCVLRRASNELFCALVKDKNGTLKTLVPAIVTTEVSGLFTAVYHNGMKMVGRVDSPDDGDEVSQVDVDMDELGRQWLNGRIGQNKGMELRYAETNIAQ